MKKYVITSMLMAIPIAAIAFICCRNRKSVDNTSVETFDLKSYLGRWYEIARFDHSFERGLSNCIANYTLNSDHTIRVLH
ncbi:MAG: lipocalin family protein, partial [Muribaculaceae bacterium]|nr:lipocalin family protein [Muribaculaceae bacterium]